MAKLPPHSSSHNTQPIITNLFESFLQLSWMQSVCRREINVFFVWNEKYLTKIYHKLSKHKPTQNNSIPLISLLFFSRLAPATTIYKFRAFRFCSSIERSFCYITLVCGSACVKSEKNTETKYAHSLRNYRGFSSPKIDMVVWVHSAIETTFMNIFPFCFLVQLNVSSFFRK